MRNQTISNAKPALHQTGASIRRARRQGRTLMLSYCRLVRSSSGLDEEAFIPEKGQFHCNFHYNPSNPSIWAFHNGMNYHAMDKILPPNHRLKLLVLHPQGPEKTAPPKEAEKPRGEARHFRIFSQHFPMFLTWNWDALGILMYSDVFRDPGDWHGPGRHSQRSGSR